MHVAFLVNILPKIFPKKNLSKILRKFFREIFIKNLAKFFREIFIKNLAKFFREIFCVVRRMDKISDRDLYLGKRKLFPIPNKIRTSTEEIDGI